MPLKVSREVIWNFIQGMWRSRQGDMIEKIAQIMFREKKVRADSKGASG
ncbi:MAG: hypothetical protein O8C61_01945 [Candidatus Methanoperedens sp.]|nr:hypothetical protein [Candidatus Methanoperedens sp.]